MCMIGINRHLKKSLHFIQKIKMSVLLLQMEEDGRVRTAAAADAVGMMARRHWPDKEEYH